MKKSEFKQLIKEEIKKILDEDKISKTINAYWNYLNKISKDIKHI